jgi:hypothetical protein
MYEGADMVRVTIDGARWRCQRCHTKRKDPLVWSCPHKLAIAVTNGEDLRKYCSQYSRSRKAKGNLTKTSREQVGKPRSRFPASKRRKTTPQKATPPRAQASTSTPRASPRGQNEPVWSLQTGHSGQSACKARKCPQKNAKIPHATVRLLNNTTGKDHQGKSRAKRNNYHIIDAEGSVSLECVPQSCMSQISRCTTYLGRAWRDNKEDIRAFWSLLDD